MDFSFGVIAHDSVHDCFRNSQVCVTVLKKRCRRHGVRRWPHRKLKSLDKLKEKLEREEAVSTDKQYYEAEIHSIVQKKDMLFRSNSAKQNSSKKDSQRAAVSSMGRGALPESPRVPTSMMSSGTKPSPVPFQHPNNQNAYVAAAHSPGLSQPHAAHMYPFHAHMSPSASAFHVSLCGLYGCDCYMAGGVSSQGFHPPIVRRPAGTQCYSVQPSPVPPYSYPIQPYPGPHPLSMIQVNVLDPSQQSFAPSMPNMGGNPTATASPVLHENSALYRGTDDTDGIARLPQRSGDVNSAGLSVYPHSAFLAATQARGAGPGNRPSSLAPQNFAFDASARNVHSAMSSSALPSTSGTALYSHWTNAMPGAAGCSRPLALDQVCDPSYRWSSSNDSQGQQPDFHSFSNNRKPTLNEAHSSRGNDHASEPSRRRKIIQKKIRDRESRENTSDSNSDTESPNQSVDEKNAKNLSDVELIGRHHGHSAPSQHQGAVAETFSQVCKNAQTARNKLEDSALKGNSSKETTPNDSSPSVSDDTVDEQLAEEHEIEGSLTEKELADDPEIDHLDDDAAASEDEHEAELAESGPGKKHHSSRIQKRPRPGAMSVLSADQNRNTVAADASRCDVSPGNHSDSSADERATTMPDKDRAFNEPDASKHVASARSRRCPGSSPRRPNVNTIDRSDPSNYKSRKRTLNSSASDRLQSGSVEEFNCSNNDRGADDHDGDRSTSRVRAANRSLGFDVRPRQSGGMNQVENSSVEDLPTNHDGVPMIYGNLNSRAKRYDHIIHQCSTLRVTMWSVDWNLQVTSAIGPKVMLGYAGVPSLGNAVVENPEAAVESAKSRRDQYLLARKGERLERILYGREGERYLHILTPLRKRASPEIIGVSGMLVELVKDAFHS